MVRKLKPSYDCIVHFQTRSVAPQEWRNRTRGTDWLEVWGMDVSAGPAACPSAFCVEQPTVGSAGLGARAVSRPLVKGHSARGGQRCRRRCVSAQAVGSLL